MAAGGPALCICTRLPFWSIDRRKRPISPGAGRRRIPLGSEHTGEAWQPGTLTHINPHRGVRQRAQHQGTAVAPVDVEVGILREIGLSQRGPGQSRRGES